MPRLGELLVATGLLTNEQVQHALRAQVMWGGRLGTNLVELGYLALDALSEALARQHRLPAALGRHFDQADPAVQGLMSPDLAERFKVVPLMRASNDRIAVATADPLDDRARALIAGELGIAADRLVVSIAAELRIRYHLERLYEIPRSARFLRIRGHTIAPFPELDIGSAEDDAETTPLPAAAPDPAAPTASLDDAPTSAHAGRTTPQALAAFELATADPVAEPERAGWVPLPVDACELPPELLQLDDTGPVIVAVDPAAPAEFEDEPSTRERRRYVATITEDQTNPLARIAIRRVAAAPPPLGQTLGEATRAIRRGDDRDRVAELAIEAIAHHVPGCEAAILLVVRGGIAVGWKGYARASDTLPEIAVPLDAEGLVPRAIAGGATLRAPASELAPIDQLLLVSLGKTTGALAVVPIAIADQVMCLLALAAPPDGDLAAAESIAAATGAAFARLMRHAAR